MSNNLTIYTDGGARGNPGPSAVGVVIIQDNQIIKKHSQFIGRATNNQAEYKAVVLALQKAKFFLGKQKAKNTELNFCLDSELVVKHLNHEYRLTDKELQVLFFEIWNLILDFKKVSFRHIPRAQNKEADKLVNEALDGEDKDQRLL